MNRKQTPSIANRILVLLICVCCALVHVGRASAQLAPDIAWMSGGHGGGAGSISISTDGQFLASVSPGDYTAKLWNTSDGRLIRTIGVAFTQVKSVAFSPDGQYLATGQDWLPGWSDSTLKLWQVSDGQLIQTFNIGAAYNIECVAYSPDGTKIATGCSDFKVRLFDAATGALLKTMSGHTGTVFSVAFSPDSATIASGSADNKGKLWKVADGSLLKTLTGHTFFVASVAFAPDGLSVATGSWDHTVRVWNVSSGLQTKLLNGPAGTAVYAIDYSPDGLFIAAAGSEAAGNAIVRIWELASNSVVHTLNGHKAAINDVQYASDRRKGVVLASAGADSLTKLWNPASTTLIRQFGIHRGGVNDVEFSPDGSVFAAATDIDATELGGDIELFDSATGAILHNCTGHTDAINAIAFSHDGAKIASAAGSPPPDTTDPSVRVWNPATGAQQLFLAGHTGGSTAVAFSIDNSMVASAGRDQRIKIWDSTTGALLKNFVAHTGWVRVLAFTPDGQYLASGGNDAKVKLWQLSDWSLVRTINVDWGVSSIDISSDSQFLIVGLDAYGDNIRQYQIADGSHIHTFPGDPNGFIDSVDLSSDNATIISGSGYTHVIQLWDVASQSLSQSFDLETGWGPDPVLPVAFSSTMTHFGYGRGDATVVLANLPLSCQAPDLTCDGVVDVDDLLALINSWGDCDAPPTPCPADISPKGGNGVVDVDDLLGLINNWG